MFCVQCQKNPNPRSQFSPTLLKFHPTSSFATNMDYLNYSNLNGPPPPSFYTAEYLRRISSISLSIFTPFPDSYTPLCLEFGSEGSSTITLVYTNNAQIKITLPSPFSPSHAYTKIKLAQYGLMDKDRLYTSLSIKAQNQDLVIPQHEADSGRKTGTRFHDKLNETPTPLSSTYLSRLYGSGANQDSRHSLQCSECSTEIVAPNLIGSWKAMPSETWAEMMDFWHCHKPDDGIGLYNKAYAVSKFIPTRRAAFVGLSYILFNNQDVNALFVKGTGEPLNGKDALENDTNLSQSSSENLLCPKCKMWIGVRDSDSSSKIYKWNLKFENMSFLIPGYLYISAHIDELISSHGVYSFVIYPDLNDPLDSECSLANPDVKKNGKDPLLIIWVFNADIRYTYTGSSAPSGDTVRRGFKVFYSSDSARIPELVRSREVSGADTESITIPQKVIDSTREHLEFGSYILNWGKSQNMDNDISPRGFISQESKALKEGWQISMLEKYQMID